jgi:hypothetical protein
MDAVVFLHRSSHTGAIVNEAADVCADAAAHAGLAEEEPEFSSASYAAIETMQAPGRPVDRGLRAWAAAAFTAGAVERLAAGDVHAQVWHEGDLQLASLGKGMESISASLLVGRCQAADDRRLCSQLTQRMVAAAGCPFGCGCSVQVSMARRRICLPGERDGAAARRLVARVAVPGAAVARGAHVR